MQGLSQAPPQPTYSLSFFFLKVFFKPTTKLYTWFCNLHLSPNSMYFESFPMKCALSREAPWLYNVSSDERPCCPPSLIPTSRFTPSATSFLSVSLRWLLCPLPLVFPHAHHGALCTSVSNFLALSSFPVHVLVFKLEFRFRLLISLSLKIPGRRLCRLQAKAREDGTQGLCLCGCVWGAGKEIVGMWEF